MATAKFVVGFYLMFMGGLLATILFIYGCSEEAASTHREALWPYAAAAAIVLGYLIFN